jgi:flagellar hook-basal body complex protein FliE
LQSQLQAYNEDARQRLQDQALREALEEGMRSIQRSQQVVQEQLDAILGQEQRLLQVMLASFELISHCLSALSPLTAPS